jgi:hypothetical protein
MSHFRVLWPDEDGQLEDEDGGVATVAIPFAAGRRPQRTAMNAIARAQSLFANRTCPYCHYPVVEPLELDDAAISKAGLPIPGTSTLVGFHCHGCDAEWGV